MNKDEILKALDLDFSKYDYYGDGYVYRVDGSGKTEAFIGGKWVKTDFNIAKKAACIFDGGMDIDVFENRQSSIDYMVEMAIESELDEPDVDNIENIIKPEIYSARRNNINQDTTGHDLLNIEDWSKITPDELNEHVQRGEIVNWIDGHDVGNSPLTSALQHNSSVEIIEILVANGADVNAATMIDGMQKTPLAIVRSHPATHENAQKELILLRAGALDDLWDWLGKDASVKSQSFSEIRFVGFWQEYKVYEPVPAQPVEFIEPHYILECQGQYRWGNGEKAWDIYDKPASYAFCGNGVEILHNELGRNFANRFYDECDQVSHNVAQFLYYEYLWSVYAYNNDNAREKRFTAAAHDFRDRFFSYDDWDELIKITPNITAKAEYRKMQQKKFPKIYAQKHKKS